MRIIRSSIIAACLLVGIANPAHARVNVDINLSLFPDLVAVPGYPVYYAPQVDRNYFFYDGRYWVYEDDDWYASDWYNGPWEFVDREYVPLYVLRVPVRYYRRPPIYFRGWRGDAPPQWGRHWGNDWERNHRGWDHWDHYRAPARAPLPIYQRNYSGDRYPQRDQQHEIRDRDYRYQPRHPDPRERSQHSPSNDHRDQSNDHRDFQQQRGPQNDNRREPARTDSRDAQHREGDNNPRVNHERVPHPQNQPANVQQPSPQPDRGQNGRGDQPGREQQDRTPRENNWQRNASPEHQNREQGGNEGRGNDRGPDGGPGRDR
ncbi:MAG: hypothetical protein JWM78_2065 [Verrucomicrobiaceae bacterium]|nr:hypothetical protein [Verrucomicrobiaceae bacterium]